MSLICKFNDLEQTYSVEFSQNGHIITLHSTNGYLPVNTSGFTISREDKSDNWDYSEFKTIYYKIDNFTYQYSDDGSVYVVPKIDVTSKAIWNDQDNILGYRPDEIIVEFLNNGKKSFDDVLKAKNDYAVTHKDRLSNRTYSINAPEIAPYQLSVSGTTAYYTLDLPTPRMITTDDLAECILDPASEHRFNIYASYIENGTKNFYKDVPEELQPMVEKVINEDRYSIKKDGTVTPTPINSKQEA